MLPYQNKNFRKAAIDLNCLKDKLMESYGKFCQKHLKWLWINEKHEDWPMKELHRKRLHSENIAESRLTGEQETCHIIKYVIDHLITEITWMFSLEIWVQISADTKHMVSWYFYGENMAKTKILQRIKSYSVGQNYRWELKYVECW